MSIPLSPTLGNKGSSVPVHYSFVDSDGRFGSRYLDIRNRKRFPEYDKTITVKPRFRGFTTPSVLLSVPSRMSIVSPIQSLKKTSVVIHYLSSQNY